MTERTPNASTATGRQCEKCSLCCKVLEISELKKARGKWCGHFKKGVGCSSYDKRPSECSSFFCGYLTWDFFGSHWFPLKCKMVVVSELKGMRIAIHVDPTSPNVWKLEPYYSELKELSIRAAHDMRQVVVCIGRRAIVILPNEDVDLGEIDDDERIITAEEKTPHGLELTALKLKKDDPMLEGLEDGKVKRINTY